MDDDRQVLCSSLTVSHAANLDMFRNTTVHDAEHYVNTASQYGFRNAAENAPVNFTVTSYESRQSHA